MGPGTPIGDDRMVELHGRAVDQPIPPAAPAIGPVRVSPPVEPSLVEVVRDVIREVDA